MLFRSRIADDFGFQPAARPAPKENVVGVDARGGRIVGRTLPIDGTADDHLVDRLEPPAVSHQFAGEPFEQVRMRGPFTPFAEVAGRRNDAASQMMLPESVDDHPGEQRPGPLVDVRQPFGECTPTPGGPRSGRGIHPPSLERAGGGEQDLQEALFGGAVFLEDVAATQIMRRRQEVGALGVQPDRRQTFRGDERLDQTRRGRLRASQSDPLLDRKSTRLNSSHLVIS